MFDGKTNMLVLERQGERKRKGRRNAMQSKMIGELRKGRKGDLGKGKAEALTCK